MREGRERDSERKTVGEGVEEGNSTHTIPGCTVPYPLKSTKFPMRLLNVLFTDVLVHSALFGMYD